MPTRTLLALIMLTLAACGTVATPVPRNPPVSVVQADIASDVTTDEDETVDTSTPIPDPTRTPTRTPIPPTATVLPSATPVEQTSDTITTLVELTGDPIHGEELFNTFWNEVGFACTTCHLHETEDRLIGPGLLNIATRAETRVEGQGAAQYIYDSILMPSDYIVEGFDDGVMPQNFRDLLTDQDVYDLIAYLNTLEDITEVDATTTGGDSSDISTIAFPDFTGYAGDPVNGELLFNAFQVDAGFACSTCHLHETEDRLIGPGLLNVATRAETRVEGQSSLEYLYTSIVAPSVYIVDGFDDGLMPQNWADVYTDEEIVDIIAYLQTLQ